MLGADRRRAGADARAAPRSRPRPDERHTIVRPLRLERVDPDADDARHRTMQDHVLAVDLLREDDAVLVVAGDAAARDGGSVAGASRSSVVIRQTRGPADE